MKVIVQLDDVVKYFDNATRIKHCLAFNMFENKTEIYQGEKKTAFKQYEIIGLEVKGDDKDANSANER